MNMTRYAIQKPIGISMVILLFVVLGLYSFSHIGVELLPALNSPYVTISVHYAGAGTEEMETQVIKPLETALSSVAHMKHITATARPENADIVLEFDLSANSDIASIDATKQVNSVRRKLPKGIDEPIVRKRDINASPILEIAVISDKPLSDVYSKAVDVFQERIQRTDGVSEVQLFGGRDKEIAVEVDQKKLRFYNLALNQIATAIKGENVLLPAGTVYSDNKQTDVRLLAQYKTPEDISKLYVNNADGVPIPLNDVATVKEQDARVSGYSRTNGVEAVSLSVYMNSDANIVKTSKGALEQLNTLKKDYPDYQFIVITNTAEFIDSSLHNTLLSLLEGLFTTGLVLYLFLRGWRSMAAVMVAIPTSLIATFFAMYIAGFSFNMMSLMGMALCVGILVDDSIVVLENIHRHMHMGKGAAVAAEEGRNEIGMAAIAITLCDVVVFMPIAFMTGMTGQFFRQFGLTIVFATLFSMLVSFTLTPMMSSRLFISGLAEPQGRLWEFMYRIEQGAIGIYERILRWSLQHSKKLLVMVMVVLVATVALLPLGVISSEYMPRTDEGSFRIEVELPVGQTIQQTNAIVAELEKYLSTEIPETTYYLSTVGTPSSKDGAISVQLANRKQRSRNIWQITDQVRGYAAQHITTATVRVLETQSSVAGVSGTSSSTTSFPIQIRLLGNNMDDLVKANDNVKQVLATVKGIKDVNSSYTGGMPELQLIVNREKAEFYQSSVAEVTNVFNAAIAGQLAGVYANDPHNNNMDTNIMVRLKGSDGLTTSGLRALPIMAGTHQVALGVIAQITDGTGPIELMRYDKQRGITIEANITDRALADVLSDTAKKITPDMVGENVSYQFVGQATSMDDTFSEMFQALALSLILVYILLAILYESLLTPVIRMLSLPLGLIGSLLFLAATHNTINLYSLIGILVMDGLVAKNGTLLLDYTLTLMEQGRTVDEAMIEAGKARLKPIFMTTITMVVGMLPTALAMTEGSETRVSMAWVLIGGLLTSTVFTLVIIPIVFLFFQHVKVSGWLKWARGRKTLQKNIEE